MLAVNHGPDRGLGLIAVTDARLTAQVDVEVVFARGVDGCAAGDRLTVDVLPLEARFPDIDRILAVARRADQAGPEFCDPAAGVHVTPHRGCILR